MISSKSMLHFAAAFLVELFVFLSVSQSFPSLPDLDKIRDYAEVEFNTSLSFGTMRKTTAIMMQQIQEELEKLTSAGNNSVVSGKC